MLYIMRQEYETDNDRKKILYTKASAFITVNIALLPLFDQIIPFQKLQAFSEVQSKWENITIIGLIILGISVSADETEKDISVAKQAMVEH